MPVLSAEPPLTPGPAPATLRGRLVRWYRGHARALPWRETLDPYRIWVSEVMLQQTQVRTALPFYQRFVRRFPTIVSLARAREPRVLAAWAGLGYYRRARNLLAAARTVVREHAGRVPEAPETFARLPGVGRYTMGAVLSLAFDRPLAALDGNVARVLSRLFALDASLRDPRGAARLWELAGRLVPARRPGEWNQAVMELGAVVCLPRAPRCDRCPVRSLCRAHATGRIGSFPPAAPRPRVRRVRRAVVAIARGDALLMVRRSGPLLDGLWEPPGVDLEPGEPALGPLRLELARLGLAVRISPTGLTIRHRITSRDIDVEVWRARPYPARMRPPAVTGVRPGTSARFVDPRRAGVPVTALAMKLARIEVERGRAERLVARPRPRPAARRTGANLEASRVRRARELG